VKKMIKGSCIGKKIINKKIAPINKNDCR